MKTRKVLSIERLAIFSLILTVLIVIVPFILWRINDTEAKEVKDNFDKIVYAFHSFFYTEDAFKLNPSVVDLNVLKERYFIKDVNVKSYGVYWIDKNAKDDGVIKAVIYYKKNLYAASVYKFMKNAIWYDPKSRKTSEYYTSGYLPAVLVEVKTL